jgi:multiple sugar transport system permease protein
VVDTAQQDRPAPKIAPPPHERRRRRQLLPYLLILPAVGLELLIHIIPLLFGIGISFLKLTQFYLRNWTAAPVAGFDNYKLALDFNQAAGQALLHSFVVTLEFTILVVGSSWLLGMAAAVFTQRTFRGRSLVRTVFLIPYALPVFASVIIWSFMLQRDTGVINHVLVDQLHMFDQRPFWLIGDNSFYSLVVVEVWRSWPFAFLCLTAGMQSIPQDLYEAAAMDGAGVFPQIRHVTLPMLTSVNRVVLIVLFLWTFLEFTVPYVLFGKSAPAQADLISMHIYQNSFVTWNFGTGSAMSVLLLAFLLVVTVGYLALFGRGSQDA